jgi:hypothetical protein
MADNVVTLEPFTMALFYSIDVAPRVAVKLCSRRTLNGEVHAAMYLAEPTPETRAAVAGYVEQLLVVGVCEFEEGFLCLCSGIAAVTAYLMARLEGAVDDEIFADKRRFDELKAREVAEAKYAGLQAALIEALAEKAPAIVTLAAADLIAGGGR